jgi:hypothetical protein
MMTAQKLMDEGCPLDVLHPHALHTQLCQYLDSIGQADGSWTDHGKVSIPALFKSDSKLAKDLSKGLRPGYIAACTDRFVAAFPQHGRGGVVNMARDIQWMAGQFAFEFSVGWRVACVTTQGEPYWFVTGLLFPQDGDALVVFAAVDEIFTVTQIH